MADPLGGDDLPEAESRIISELPSLGCDVFVGCQLRAATADVLAG
jgi:hypothetical protein